MTFENLNATTMGDVFVYSNTVTGGFFWSGMLFVVWLLGFFILNNRSGFKRSFAASSFFSMILGGVMYMIGEQPLVSSPILMIFIVFTIAGVIMLYSEEKK